VDVPGGRTRRGWRWAAAVAAVGLLAPLTATVTAASHTTKAAAATSPSVLREVHGGIDTATAPIDASQTAGCSATADKLQAGAAVVVNSVTPGRIFSLTADAGTWQDDFDASFYSSVAQCQAGQPRITYTNHAGDENSVVPTGAGIVVVTLASGKTPSLFTYREYADSSVPVRLDTARKPTVMAIIEPVDSTQTTAVEGFSPYHVDFLGRDHPWNTDADTTNDIDFNANPATYIAGYPADATGLSLHLPTSDTDAVSTLETADDGAWKGMAESTSTSIHPYWLTGTKVIAALRFSQAAVHPTSTANNGHGTGASSVAAGNFHGTCAECLLVWISIGNEAEEMNALDWAARQPWIDVISNSYVRSAGARANEWTAAGHFDTTAGGTEGLYLGSNTSSRTLKAVRDSGKIVAWASGNGVAADSFLANTAAYWSSEHGPDWVVTVGAVTPRNDQPLRGGLPVDVSAYGESYPGAGGTTANTSTNFSGTSNATPVVAGTMARMIQWGRDVTGDNLTHSDPQVVAQGRPVPCATGVLHCPLDDGKLTRTEVEQTLFNTVLPSPFRQLPPGTTAAAPDPVLTVPTSGPATAITVDKLPTDDIRDLPAVDSYISEGHGIVYGRLDTGRYAAEQRSLQSTLLGKASLPARPPADPTWFVVDSKCRQKMWGTWDMGLYTGKLPAFDPNVDQTAMAWNSVCDQIPQDFLADAPDSSQVPNT
jgi:hypothetical protein